MGEETIISSYIGSIVKKSVAEALAREVPKYLSKKEKRYYTIKQVCELMGIKCSTYFTRETIKIIWKITINAYFCKKVTKTKGK